MNLIAQQLSPFDEIAPALGYMLLAAWVVLVIALYVAWEYKNSASDRLRREQGCPVCRSHGACEPWCDCQECISALHAKWRAMHGPDEAA